MVMGIFLSYFVLECGGLAAAFEADAPLKKLTGPAKPLKDVVTGKAVASYRTPKALDLQAAMSNF